ncbi:MAG TPA: LysR substrate-binding domain-containing protein, partial [Solirubrobacteraceae bacterium]|nr:LysR substrate-binding domain-containing protein [Solirubrobacteraceae bacterium]
RRLAVFREVARRGSFTLAAEALSYSQPAVSHHVTSLEREIGAKLLDRGSRGELHLTEVGTVMLEQAETLLEAAAVAEREINRTINGDGEIHLGVTGGAPIVADALVRFHRANPGADLKLFEGDRIDAITALRARELDIGLIVDDPEEPLPPDAKFESEPLYADPLLLVLPEHHPLAEVEVIDLIDLAEDSWVDRVSDTSPWASHHPGLITPWSKMLKSACAAAGFEPRIAISARNPLTVQRLVVAGVGVALLSELALADPHPRVRIREFQPAKTRSILLARNNSSSSEQVLQLSEALRLTARDYARTQPRRLRALLANGPAQDAAPPLATARRIQSV